MRKSKLLIILGAVVAFIVLIGTLNGLGANIMLVNENLSGVRQELETISEKIDEIDNKSNMLFDIQDDVMNIRQRFK